MMRSAAVMRIQDGLGFAARQSDKIALRLQEAQRELEKGKTLPNFLLREGTGLTALKGERYAFLPNDFLRLGDELWFNAGGAGVNIVFVDVLHRYNYREALKKYFSNDAGPPSVGMIRKGVTGLKIMDFFRILDQDYLLGWTYYGADDVLTTDIENRWLKNSPEWLIGEAGWRMAMDVRDKDAMTLFDAMRKMGRASCLGEEIATEDAEGPVYLGEAL